MYKTGSSIVRLWWTTGLEVFMNALPMRLYWVYWVFFLTEDFRQVVETAKRIPTKEKIDRQLTGQ